MGYISRPVFAVMMLLAIVITAGPAARADDKPRTVNLIPLIDVKQDSIRGTWKLDHGAIVSDDSPDACLRIHYEPPQEYDFHIEFVRTSGNKDVIQIFRNFDHSCLWQMGAWNNTICGFSNIDGVDSGNGNNPTRFHGRLENGRKYSSLIQVRKGSVVAFLDGKIISKCSLDPSEFSAPDNWSACANGLGLGSTVSSTVFGVVEVVEISGPGKVIPRDKSNQQQDNQQVTQTKQAQPDDAPKLHADNAQDDKPISGATTRVSKPISTIKALEVYTTDSGMMLGQTSEMVLTVTRGDTSKATNVRYVMPIGPQMALARDEALRFIRVTYPNWYADEAELTFEDKYVPHDGGSNGTAVGTLILSAIEGFKIDSDAAITGDISANGKVRAIGGISAKIRGATASKCDIVAVPMENYDQLVDAMVYSGPDLVTDIQVIGISDLDDAVSVMRTDRDAGLVKAMSLFEQIQQNIHKSPSYIHSEAAQEKLVQVLDLAPQHLSAKLLLLVAQDKEPKTLSATASMYYTDVAVGSMWAIVRDRAQLHTIQVPSAAVKQGLADLKKLRPLADKSVYPYIDACSRFIWGCSMYEAGNVTLDTVLNEAEAIDDALAQLQSNQDLMQKALKEGM